MAFLFPLFLRPFRAHHCPRRCLFRLAFCLSAVFWPSFQQQFPFRRCDQFPNDPACRLQAFAENQQFNFANQQNGLCNYQDLWLIPGKADSSCTRPNPKRLVELDAKNVKVHPPIVKFPGCFTVEIKNVHILDAQDPSGRSIFAKTEYQWLNAAAAGDSNDKCQNASANGCGGFGNNCYYCDICESLKAVDERPKESGDAEQLRGMKCPTQSGLYTFRKQFCFNDWAVLDANRDCRLDFLETSVGDDQSGLKSAMSALQQVGYGTVVAKVRLAYNATPEIARKKVQKEAIIERTAMRDLERRKENWDSRRGSFDEFSHWFIEQRKGKWHREEYLPWLLYENEIACIRLTFDVCERPPQERWDGQGGYTCN